MNTLAAIRHVALDMDGTIYKGRKLFPATLPFLATLAKLRIGHTFLTNNTSRSKADYVAKLRDLGIDAKLDEIATPVDATIAYLNDRYLRRVALLGTQSLIAEMTNTGFIIDWDDPEAVVVAFDMELDYVKLCRTAYWISRGLPYIATHPDLICPTDEPTMLVDCGAICAALNAATGREPVVLGKPEPAMIDALCRCHGLQPHETAMVGDRLYTDIAMARRAGALAVLVLSGEATAEAVAASQIKPDLVVDDISELGRMLVGSAREE